MYSDDVFIMVLVLWLGIWDTGYGLQYLLQMPQVFEALHGGDHSLDVAAVHRLHEAAVRGVDFRVDGIGLSFERPLGFAPCPSAILLEELDMIADTERVARNVGSWLSGTARSAFGECLL